MVEAFETLKSEMMEDLSLAYPDYHETAEKLELYVDASAVGAGAYLAQQQEGSHRIIGFASMTFSQSQLNYSTLERELTALRWGIKTFRPFLYGVEFLLFTDHQPLVHLHNMKLVCSRLARTLEELADYVFEIRYVPGHLNSAADALSRLGTKLPCADLSDVEPVLPDGLVVDGLPVSGGGDSLFVSLHRSLGKTSQYQVLSDLKLREKVADELLNNPARYNLKLDRDGHKELRLMRCKGQLPSLEVLMSASYLFKIKIHVYFWTNQPVIYQFSDYSDSIYLQCISGIHFNPLLEVRNFIPPNPKLCSVNLINQIPIKDQCERVLNSSVDENDLEDDCISDILAIDNSIT
jgi:hypothetical protein